MDINKIALIGGLFAVFTFVHFVIDWIFQTHAEAMAKHNNPKVRARHCLVYTLGFVPLMLLLKFSLWKFVLGANILFWSHYIEDTYLPIFLWAKYIRRPPEMTNPIVVEDPTGLISAQVLPPDPKAGFIKFVSTPLGKILMITIDQIIHLAFLFPLVWLAFK